MKCQTITLRADDWPISFQNLVQVGPRDFEIRPDVGGLKRAAKSSTAQPCIALCLNLIRWCITCFVAFKAQNEWRPQSCNASQLHIFYLKLVYNYCSIVNLLV